MRFQVKNFWRYDLQWVCRKCKLLNQLLLHYRTLQSPRRTEIGDQYFLHRKRASSHYSLPVHSPEYCELICCSDSSNLSQSRVTSLFSIHLEHELYRRHPVRLLWDFEFPCTWPQLNIGCSSESKITPRECADWFPHRLNYYLHYKLSSRISSMVFANRRSLWTWMAGDNACGKCVAPLRPHHCCLR